MERVYVAYTYICFKVVIGRGHVILRTCYQGRRLRISAGSGIPRPSFVTCGVRNLPPYPSAVVGLAVTRSAPVLVLLSDVLWIGGATVLLEGGALVGGSLLAATVAKRRLATEHGDDDDESNGADCDEDDRPELKSVASKYYKIIVEKNDCIQKLNHRMRR